MVGTMDLLLRKYCQPKYCQPRANHLIQTTPGENPDPDIIITTLPTQYSIIYEVDAMKGYFSFMTSYSFITGLVLE